MSKHNRIRFFSAIGIIVAAAVIPLSVCCKPSENHANSVVALGDSNTWLGKDACSDPRGWTYHMAGALPAISIRSYARSGATWSETAKTRLDTAEYSEVITDDNVVRTQIARLKADVDRRILPSPDVIIISSGTNDAWFETKYRPGALSMTDTISPRSLYGAVRASLDDIAGAFPDARVILLTPMQSTAVPDSRIHLASDIIDRAAGCATVVRLDSLSPVRSCYERNSRTYTYDGTHTSPRGAKANADIILKYLTPMLGQK